MYKKIIEAGRLPVNGEPVRPLSGTVEGLARMFLRFVEFEIEEMATLLSLWVVQTFCFEQFDYSGMIRLESASPSVRQKSGIGIT